MKQLLHTTIWVYLLLLPVLGSAQGVIAIDDTVVADIFEIDISENFLDLELKTRITNLSDTTIRLKWTRFELDKPGEWDTQVCDNNDCYIPIVDSNIDDALGLDAPVILEPDSSFDMILYVVPNGTPGTGRIELDLSLAERPGEILQTIVYLPDVRERTVSNVEDLLAPDLRIFPNPAAHSFELTSHQGIDQIVVTNMFGRHMGTYPASSGRAYDVSQMPDGIYLIRLINQQYGVIRTMRLVKQGVRP